MANITRKSWPLGWIPSDNKSNGRVEGLIRMDNLQLDDNGILSLCKSYEKVADYPTPVYNCYSKYFSTTKVRYAALQSGEVYKDGAAVVVDGNEHSAFGSALGQTLISCGLKRYKDNGTSVNTLGILPPTTSPVITALNQPELELSDLDGNGNFTEWENVLSSAFDNTNDYISFSVNAAGFGVVQDLYSFQGLGSPINTMLINTGIGTDDDVFSFYIRISDTKDLLYVRLEFLLDEPPERGQMSYVSDYYTYVWENSDVSTFVQGVNAWTKLEARRGDFVRSGNTPGKFWDNVYAIRLSVIATGPDIPLDAIANSFKVIGSSNGPLNDIYEYMQVNVANTGTYLAKSTKGLTGFPIRITNGSASISPNLPQDPQVNELWFYRRSYNSSDFTRADNQQLLEQWYRVGISYKNAVGTFPDIPDAMSDRDALTLNETYNENLLSVQDIPDDILDIVGLHFDRTLYMTFKEIYLSEQLCPDLVDTRATIKVSGDTSERNLWLKKAGTSTVYLGTTVDIYEISGTLNRFPDGSLDVVIRGLGLGNPPISHNAVVHASAIIYMANDGWRQLSGNGSTLLSEQLSLLFQGETRSSVPPVLIVPNGGAEYPCAIAHNKLFTSNPLIDTRRTCFVLDFENTSSGRPNYWYAYWTDPICFFTEEDGTLIAGYNLEGAGGLFTLDQGMVNPLNVEMKTVYDDDNLPRNRKDLFTFKITCDTGGAPIRLFLGKDVSDQWIFLGEQSFNGPEEKLVTISESVGYAKNIAFRLLGENLTTLKIYNFSIEYDPRPEQLTYLRIPYNNLGTMSRKRFINYAFVIDTLGVDTEFFPLIDGEVRGNTSIVNLDRKGTHIHYFDSEQTGIDIGGLLCGFFEFYGINIEEIHSEKMPVPATFLIIPQDDYGVPNRKRHSSYKFVINTRGGRILFTPRIDGVYKDPTEFTTTEKETVEYFFTVDTTGIDIGGKIESIEEPKQPFEFYGPIRPQKVEVLPDRLKEFWIPENNYGIAAKKRIRTMPMEINTNGSDVIFTPIIDGVSGTPTIINTSKRKTVFHYFNTDVFGIDFSGELVGTNPFEFYGLMKPEEVEIIPVGKKFDQVGPIHFSRIGKLIGFRTRLIATSTNNIPYTIYMDDSIIRTGNLENIQADKDLVYEIEYLPKSINGTTCRLELGPGDVFHRYYIDMKINLGGDHSEIRTARTSHDGQISWMR